MIELIAEISGCHGGSLDNALKLIEAAALSGATGVKFQCFEPERLAIRRAGHPRLRETYKPAEDGGPTHQLRSLYKQIHTPQEWFPTLISAALHCGLTWHASVFDPEDVAFLEKLGCPRYKIASFELADDDIGQAIRNTGKPYIISVNQHDSIPLGWEFGEGYTLLHATDYGVPPNKAGLGNLRTLANRQDLRISCRWGLSDHTIGSHLAAQIATTLGASMIEWHIKLPDVHTPDDGFAFDRQDFALKVIRVRAIEEVLK